jgi:hypothetical protein
MQTEFPHDIAAVYFDRCDADVQVSGDARRTTAVGEQPEDLALAVAQRPNRAERSAACAIPLTV